MNEFQVIKRIQIDGDFTGFDDEVLFKLMDGTYWVQDEFRYWYYYSYCPLILILQKNNRFYLQVDGQSEIVPVRQIYDVIESSIKGEFKGWDGKTTYELMNGQVWKQSEYKYEYVYAHMPEVLIYDPGGGHIMQVEGTTARVNQIK